jgi:parvulin-like peptidyl-prolyl isomerase
MDRAEFEKALAKQGKNLESYKTDIKSEILKSRLANQIFQSGVGVSSDDIELYLKQHPELGHGGSKIKLSQIFVSTDKRSQDEGQKIVESVLMKIKDGEKFSELAKELSDSPDAAEGGSLGTVVQEELNSSIFDAISSLKDGEVSTVVSGPDGFRIFRVDERLDQKEEDSEEARSQARKALQQQKLQTKMQDYFTIELYKLHSVDKKI